MSGGRGLVGFACAGACAADVVDSPVVDVHSAESVSSGSEGGAGRSAEH